MIRRPPKATIRDARTHNERLVLSTIYEVGPVHVQKLRGDDE